MERITIPYRSEAQGWFQQNILKRDFDLNKIEFDYLPLNEDKSIGGSTQLYCKKRMIFIGLLLSPLWIKLFLSLNKDNDQLWVVILGWLICMCMYAIPFLAILSHKPKVLIVEGIDSFITERIIVHELTHVLYNHSRLRFAFQFTFKMICMFLPVDAYEIEEGLAVWVEEQYALAHNQPFEINLYPDWYQKGYHSVKKWEKSFGKSFVIFIINYL